MMKLRDFKLTFPKWKEQPFEVLLPSIDPVGRDLLIKMLQLDPRKRISCKDAMNHPYFADIKK